MSSTLIAYFSYQGHTREIAEQISRATGGALFEIRPATAYSSDYDACEALAKKETRDGFQPELAERMENLDTFGTVMLGTPNWFNTIAPPVATFLASNDFSGKTILPFCTHGGGGLGRVAGDIRKLADGATVLESLTVYEGEVKNAEGRIRAWLDTCGLSK